MKKLHFKRDNCRLCQSKKVKKVINLEPVPVGEKYANSIEELNDIQRFPIDLYWCSECGCVQVLDVINSVYLWSGYTYFSGQTKGIVEHFIDFGTKVMADYNLAQDDLVIDIGSNDGSLLKVFKNKKMKVLGIDPATELAELATKNGIPTIPKCFDLTTANQILNKQGKASVITAFNVFAHSDEMQSMLDGIELLLDDNGVFIFEVQYLVDILNKKLLGTIFHEHMIHHSVSSLQKFFAKKSLKIIKIDRVNIQKGSIIGYVCKNNSIWEEDSSVKKILNLEKEMKTIEYSTIQNFEHWLIEQKNKILQMRKEWEDKNLNISGFGAARSGPTLAIQFGLENIMSNLFDDHNMKVNKYAPFENLKVLPTNEITKNKVDILIVLAWIHTKKIIENNQEFLENGGKFLALYPEVKLIDINNVKEVIK